jgi:hypothetical protein
MSKDGGERFLTVNKGTEQSLQKVGVAVSTDLLAQQELCFSRQTSLYQRNSEFIAVEFGYSAKQFAGSTA